MNRQCGFSLSELLLANFIGLCLSSLIIIFYQNIKNFFTDYSAMIHQQQNIRLLHTWFKNKIAQAGYMGCLQLPLTIEANAKFTGITIVHDRAQILKLLNQAYDYPIANNSDLLMIQYMGPLSIETQQIQANQITVVLQPPILSTSEKLIINDCQHAEVISIETIRNNKYAQLITFKQPPQYSYQHNIQIGGFITELFFIAETKRKNRVGQPIFALYRLIKNSNNFVAEELLEGIDRMRITHSLGKVQAEFLISAPYGNNKLNMHPKKYVFIATYKNF